MNLEELRTEFRERADDLAEPYLWADTAVNRWINEAEREAAERARLIYDESTKLSRINLEPGKAEYTLSPLVLDVDQFATRVSDSRRIDRITREQLDQHGRHWLEAVGDPVSFYFIGNVLRPYPAPVKADTLQLSVWRLPRETMEGNQDEPEIAERYHERLLDWVLFRAFSKRDPDTHDPGRAANYEAAFEASFGIRRDSNVQRKQRRHRVTTTKPIW